jgi:creatinine amidohydrolase
MMHGYIPPQRFLPYLSWTEIDALPDRGNTVIVLPVGAIEQHGPHLPCAVDSVISAGVLGRALAKLPDAVRAFGLAPLTYGKSDEHLHFPGTMTLTGPTLLNVVQEIGESVYRAGFRKLLLANGHGGQPQVLEMAARELRLRHGDFVMRWPRANCACAMATSSSFPSTCRACPMPRASSSLSRKRSRRCTPAIRRPR